MFVEAAERDLAAAEVGGAPGVFVSGLAWLVAGLILTRFGVPSAFAALFIGGMLITPLALAIARFGFRAPKSAPGNPLERLGLESAFILFAGLAIAYALLRASPQLAFPALAITIGARYFAFRTLYGEPIYWALGATLAGLGTIALFGLVPLPVNIAVSVGAVEIAFAGWLLARHRGRAAAG